MVISLSPQTDEPRSAADAVLETNLRFAIVFRIRVGCLASGHIRRFRQDGIVSLLGRSGPAERLTRRGVQGICTSPVVIGSLKGLWGA